MQAIILLLSSKGANRYADKGWHLLGTGHHGQRGEIAEMGFIKTGPPLTFAFKKDHVLQRMASYHMFATAS